MLDRAYEERLTVLTRTRSRLTRTSQIRLLTTQLDPDLHPAGQIAVNTRNDGITQVSVLRLKRTVRGAGRLLRGRSAALACQEASALLFAHNMIAGLAPGQVTFTALRSLATPIAPHCDKRPSSENAPLAGLDAAILALPPGPSADIRPHRRRTPEID